VGDPAAMRESHPVVFMGDLGLLQGMTAINASYLMLELHVNICYLIVN
jgi:hypothetical protein